MKFELEDYNRGVTDSALLDELKRLASVMNKRAISRSDNDDQGKYGTTTYIRRFGSWFKALEAAGLEKTRTQMNLPEEELFQNLEEIWIKLGRQPRYAEVQKPLSRFHVGTYENRFGTWRKALERFVAFVNNDEELLKREVDQTKEFEFIGIHKTKRTINWRLRFVVMKRDNFKCQSCGQSPATDAITILHIDHIRAWTNGGETVLENLQTLCSICNIGKSDLE